MILQKLKVRKNEDLFEKTGNENYRGIVIENIDNTEGIVFLTNHPELHVGESTQPSLTQKEIFRIQIENTIKYHFQKQKELLPRGIKVLSLFFIDKVSNYTDEKGMIKILFDEAFNKLKQQYPFYKGWKAETVRNGYFAKKQNKNQATEYIDTHVEDDDKTTADKELEKATYELIMKEKEKLLGFDEKVSFIFAHSALKEGWDNPNVFQIVR